MDNVAALKVALDIFHVPSHVQWQRSAPLPTDVVTILLIAAGDAAALHNAVSTSGQLPEKIVQAAVFFLEQIVLSAKSDSYRVLAATSNASNAELRRNMALLMRWLHPDQRQGQERAALAARVTTAWEDLKTADRRAAYDAHRPVTLLPTSKRKGKSKPVKVHLKSRMTRARNHAKITQLAFSERFPHLRLAKSPGLLQRALRLFTERLWR
jgi:pyruvate-formate lyase-activating enzyme